VTYRVLEHGEEECERSEHPAGHLVAPALERLNGTQPSLLEGEGKEVKTSSVGDTGCFKTEKSIRKELRSRSVGKGNEKKKIKGSTRGLLGTLQKFQLTTRSPDAYQHWIHVLREMFLKKQGERCFKLGSSNNTKCSASGSST